MTDLEMADLRLRVLDRLTPRSPSESTITDTVASLAALDSVVVWVLTGAQPYAQPAAAQPVPEPAS